ncbi:DUF362 domain-containing protein [Planctomycetota bacterium]
MTNKRFTKSLLFLLVGTGLVLCLNFWPVGKSAYAQHKFKSRVIVVRNSKIRNKDKTLNSLQIKRTLNAALRALTLKDSGREALKQLIGPQDIVGLQVNTFQGKLTNATRPELAAALGDFIKQTGVPENNIIIWDRAQDELESVGYQINRSKQGMRCLASLTARPGKRNSSVLMGYADQEINLWANCTTRISSIIARHCSININMPVLRTHKFKEDTGINNAVMNMYHAIELTNTNKKPLCGNQCDPGAAEIYALPALKNKTKLIVCDAFSPLYQGGPFDDPRYHWNYNGLIVGFDPVAVDIVGLKILQKYRTQKGNSKWLPLEPGYLLTCAQPKYKLGNADFAYIDLTEMTLD